MATHYTNDAAFDLPDLGFVDRTVTTLDVTTAAHRAHTVLVNRAPLPAGQDLPALVAENLARADRSLPGHRVLFRREATIAGCPALEVAASWSGQGGPVYTRQARLVASGVWLAITANAPLDDRAACDRRLDHALATLRLRQ